MWMCGDGAEGRPVGRPDREQDVGVDLGQSGQHLREGLGRERHPSRDAAEACVDAAATAGGSPGRSGRRTLRVLVPVDQGVGRDVVPALPQDLGHARDEAGVTTLPRHRAEGVEARVGPEPVHLIGEHRVGEVRQAHGTDADGDVRDPSLRGGDLARELGDLADDEVRRELVHDPSGLRQRGAGVQPPEQPGEHVGVRLGGLREARPELAQGGGSRGRGRHRGEALGNGAGRALGRQRDQDLVAGRPGRPHHREQGVEVAETGRAGEQGAHVVLLGRCGRPSQGCAVRRPRTSVVSTPFGGGDPHRTHRDGHLLPPAG